MTFIINLPPTLRKRSQQVMWGADPLADILTPENVNPTILRTVHQTGRSICRAVARIRRELKVETPIYYCLVHSPTLQACAFKPDDRTYCIAIWMGVAAYTFRAIRRLLATPTLAAFFRLEPSPSAALKLDGSADTYTAYQRLWFEEFPPAPDSIGNEHIIAKVLNTFVMDFVVHHEVGHVINGHLALSSVGTAGITESGEPPADHAMRVIAHTLEWDADRFAARWVASDALKYIFPTEEMYAFRSREQQLYNRMRMAVLAIYIACRMFQRRAFAFEETFLQKHPHGEIRLNLAFALAKRTWERMVGSHNIAFPESIFLDVAWICEKAISEALGGTPPHQPVLHTDHLDWFLQYQKTLSECWAEIRPILENAKLRPDGLVASRPTP